MTLSNLPSNNNELFFVHLEGNMSSSIFVINNCVYLLFIVMLKLETITSAHQDSSWCNIFTAYKMFLGPVRLESVWFENALEQQHMLLNAADRMITTNVQSSFKITIPSNKQEVRGHEPPRLVINQLKTLTNSCKMFINLYR